MEQSFLEKFVRLCCICIGAQMIPRAPVHQNHFWKIWSGSYVRHRKLLWTSGPESFHKVGPSKAAAGPQHPIWYMEFPSEILRSPLGTKKNHPVVLYKSHERFNINFGTQTHRSGKPTGSGRKRCETLSWRRKAYRFRR
jgi:hypothetical protein